MRKINQKGFSAIEGLLLLVIVGLVAFVVWYAFHTKNTTNNTLNGAASTQIAPKTTKPKSSTNTTKTNAASEVVTTKTDSKAGQYLADTSGKTLYTYGADTSGVSNCNGSCVATWPIYKATSTSNLPANITIINRSDGTKQYAYKGMPLYYYAIDTSAGMINGDGVDNFHVAKP